VFCLQENDFAVEAFHKTHPKSIDVATRTSEMSGMRAAFAHIANARSPLPKKAHGNEDPFAPSPPVRLFLAIFGNGLYRQFWNDAVFCVTGEPIQSQRRFSRGPVRAFSTAPPARGHRAANRGSFRSLSRRREERREGQRAKPQSVRYQFDRLRTSRGFNGDELGGYQSDGEFILTLVRVWAT